MTNTSPAQLSGWQYYGLVWRKSQQLEKRGWLKRVFADLAPTVIGMSILALLFGFKTIIESRRHDLALLGIGLIVYGVWRFFACLARAPHAIYLEDQAQLASVRTERDAAVAKQNTTINRQKAFEELTILIQLGSNVRQQMNTAVLNPSGYGTTTQGLTPSADADLKAVAWHGIAKKVAQEHFPELYPRLLAMWDTDCGIAPIGPSHKSSTLAKLNRILDLLSEHAARLCQ